MIQLYTVRQRFFEGDPGVETMNTRRKDEDEYEYPEEKTKKGAAPSYAKFMRSCMKSGKSMEECAKEYDDRYSPPKKGKVMIVALVLVAFVSVSSFFVAQRAFTLMGFPSPTVRVSNNSPRLVVVDDQLYVAVEVETTVGTFLDFSRSKICLAKLSLDGSVDEETIVFDLGKSLLKYMDLLVASDGRWYLAFVSRLLSWGASEPSDLYVVSSDDGRIWEEPTIIAKSFGKYTGPSMTEEYKRKIVEFNNPSLTAIKDGEVFLSFNIKNKIVAYSTLESDNGWSMPRKIKMRAEHQSSFLDRDGNVSVLGVDVGPPSIKAIIVEGILQTKMRDDGNWTEPRYLTYLNINIRGYFPEIYYSPHRDGYFLTIRDPDPNSFPPDQQIVFTPDFENWGRFTSITNVSVAYKNRLSIAELPDGTLVSAFVRRRSSTVYISTSSDGVNWTTPVKVEKIRDKEALEMAASRQRNIASKYTSVAAAVCVILFIYLKPKPAQEAGKQAKRN